MKHPGISTHRESKADQRRRMNALTKMAQGTLKVRKPRTKEDKPRKRLEDKFRNEEVYPFLKTDKRIKDYKRIENGIGGIHGSSIPDFLFWTFKNQYWLELKAPGGGLDNGQEVFRCHCLRTKAHHITARSISDIEEGIRRVEGC